MATTNHPPKCQWFAFQMACGTRRSRLVVDGVETPFFIDSASVIAHRSAGQKHGLYGSGMGKTVHCRDGSTYRIAEMLSSSDTIAILKHRAEQTALGG